VGEGLTDVVVLRAVTDALERGRAVVLASVIDSSRSVPRRSGARMAVVDDGTTVGTVGGGEMEARVVREAADLVRAGTSRRLHFDLVDPASGDPGVCGGTVELFLESFMPKPTLFVIGCGHVGRAVVDLAHWMGYRTVAVDDRVEIGEPGALPHADYVVVGSVEEALAAHPVTEHTAVVLVTRNVAVDAAALPHVLRTPASYIGVMGSARRWSTTRRQLHDAGVSDGDLAKVRSPIGVEIGAETPEEIAVSIMAEVVAARRGGEPAPG